MVLNGLILLVTENFKLFFTGFQERGQFGRLGGVAPASK